MALIITDCAPFQAGGVLPSRALPSLAVLPSPQELQEAFLLRTKQDAFLPPGLTANRRFVILTERFSFQAWRGQLDGAPKPLIVELAPAAAAQPPSPALLLGLPLLPAPLAGASCKAGRSRPGRSFVCSRLSHTGHVAAFTERERYMLRRFSHWSL